MPYSREIKQVLSTILKAGSGAEAILELPAKADPLTGIPTGSKETANIPMVIVTYDRADYADSSLTNGLIKVLLPPVDKGMKPIPDFLKFVKDKNTTIVLPDGTRLKILHTKITKPDGLTPILARVYLGG